MSIYAATTYDIDIDKFILFLKEHRTHVEKTEVNDLLTYYKIFTEEHKKKYPTCINHFLKRIRLL